MWIPKAPGVSWKNTAPTRGRNPARSLCGCIQDAVKRIGDSPFAYADSWDEKESVYRGLVFNGEAAARAA